MVGASCQTAFFPTFASVAVSSWLRDRTLPREGTKICHLPVFHRLTFSCENIPSRENQIKLCTSRAFIKAAEIFLLLSIRFWGAGLSKGVSSVAGAARASVWCCCTTPRPADSDYPGYWRIFTSSALLLKLQPYQTSLGNYLVSKA